jgi:hypothetical protein
MILHLDHTLESVGKLLDPPTRNPDSLVLGRTGASELFKGPQMCVICSMVEKHCLYKHNDKKAERVQSPPCSLVMGCVYLGSHLAVTGDKIP